MPFRIRDARAGDVPALSSLHVQTFTETHRGGRPGRLFGDRGEFNGGYGWRDLPRLIARCDEG